MDRELDFNVENEMEKEYEKWKTHTLNES